MADLESEDEERIGNLVETLTTNCQLNGTYDINIEEWACTRYPSKTTYTKRGLLEMFQPLGLIKSQGQ